MKYSETVISREVETKYYFRLPSEKLFQKVSYLKNYDLFIFFISINDKMRVTKNTHGYIINVCHVERGVSVVLLVG